MINNNNEALQDKEYIHENDVFHSEHCFLLKRTKNKYI